MGNAEKFGRIIKYIRKEANPTVGVHYLDIFMEVAKRKNGITQHELLPLVGVGLGSITRFVKSLELELGLIKSDRDLEDYKKKRLYLTPKGQKFIEGIDKIMEG